MKMRELVIYVMLVLFLGVVSCSDEETDPPIIVEEPDSIAFNELHSTGNPDWIELYNYGNADVNLEGWKVFDSPLNMYTLPAGHIVKPGNFLILHCDDQGVGLNLPFKLSSQGESLTIQRPDGKVIDQIVFPAMDGETYARFPDGQGTWQITGFATKNESNGDRPISTFKSYGYTPEIPMVGEVINFNLEISDASNVSNVEMVYRVENGADETLIMTSGDNINYTATVPALSADGELYYYFKLTDTNGLEVLLPDDALVDPYDMTITSGDVPNLVINYILAIKGANLSVPDGV